LSLGLDVVVEGEFVWSGAQPDRVDIVLAFPGEPGVDEVGGEDAAVEKIVVIGFERVEDFGERSGGLPDAAVLLRR
jgi:hypothetical protein